MKTWTESWTHAIAATVMVAAGMTVGCGAGESGNQSGGARAARSLLGVTGAAIDRVLGMETPTADWKIANSQAGTLGSSATTSQGAASLAVQAHGYASIQSVALSSLGTRVGSALQVDLQFQGGQPNPWWWGELTIGVDSSSLGISASQGGMIINAYDLTGKLSSGWTTLTFDVPAALQASLAGTYDDLQITIILNVQTNSTGTYLVDNLRFLNPGPPSTGTETNTSTATLTTTTTNTATETSTSTGTATETATNTTTVTGTTTATTTGTSTSVDGGIRGDTRCLSSWEATPCGQWCLDQPQSDWRNCRAFLDCYRTNNCGPETCGKSPDDVCGVNVVTPGMGTAGQERAAVVWQCLSCPGSSPVPSCIGYPDSAPCTGSGACSKGNTCSAGQCTCADPEQAPDPTEGFSTFAGTLTGELTVSPTGAAMYKVPIVLPPGVAGMAPNLALVYSSQGGNGVAGQGWDLTGLSLIQRCPRSRPEDGYARAVTMSGPLVGDNADGICLDGKRLFDRGASADGKGRRFEPEISEFSDITMSSDELMFTVVTKSGETRYYGKDDRGRVRGGAHSSSSSSPVGEPIAVWLLQKVVDVWGNYFDLHYNFDETNFDTSGILVSRIDYTGRLRGSAADNEAAEVPTFETVQFMYESRSDVRRSRFRAMTVPRNQRLTKIITSIGVYTLDYRQPTVPPTTDDTLLPSLLRRISYCSKNGMCVLPLEFDWDGGGYAWEPKSGLKLPDTLTAGTWFMDLNGDGRPDLVSSQPDSWSKVWKNTGSSFELAPGSWSLPSDIWQVPNDVLPGNTAFADLDGDGLLDGIHINPRGCLNGKCDGADGTVWLNRIRTENKWVKVGRMRPRLTAWPYSLHIAEPDHSASEHRGLVVDIDGDGRADLVSMAAGASEPMKVMLSAGINFDEDVIEWYDASDRYGGITPIVDYELRDVNRDGLPDLVGKKFTSAAGKTYVNTGSVLPGYTTVWIPFDVGLPDNMPHFMEATADFDGDGLHDILQFGCLLSRNPQPRPPTKYLEPCVKQVLWEHDIPRTKTIVLSTGLGYEPLPLSDPRNAILNSFTPEDTTIDTYRMEDYAPIALDINADGLADLVQRVIWPWPNGPVTSAAGRVLFNTGTTFKALDGASSYKDPAGIGAETLVPRVPRAARMSAGTYDAVFLDLDGDGVTDLGGYNNSWRNTFRPPIIIGFPNGLAKKTVPTYTTITSAEAQRAIRPGHPVYSDSTWAGAPVAAGTAVMITPLRVVSSLGVDDGIGGAATSDYEYRDLRASPSGRGPEGFGTVIVTAPKDRNQNTRIESRTQYRQAFPYTGQPWKVERYLVDASSGQEVRLLSRSITDYCDAQPGTAQTCTPNDIGDGSTQVRGTTRFVRATSTVETSYLVSSAALAGEATSAERPATISTTFFHDGWGNPTETTVRTAEGAEIYEKKIVNVYGAPKSKEERLGKVTETSVTTNRVEPQDCLGSAITHTTRFEYGEVNRFLSPVDDVVMETLGLVKTIVEPGSGQTIELHTAYQYDRFGNTTRTTACASDFESCGNSGAKGSADLPYRITQVSYDPADFTPPPGSGRVTGLTYGAGRFPVKTINAAGHTEYTAYDKRFGTLTQQTGPNGVSTCKQYDGLGRLAEETVRCGSNGELTTTIRRVLPHDWATGPIKVVTVTTPPSGSPSWVYTDGLGRTRMTLTRSFEGKYVKTLRLYDNLGRISVATKPFLSSTSDLFLGAEAHSTITQYDALGRVTSVSEDLGVLDGTVTGDPGAPRRSTTVLTTYDGPEVTTTQTANGETRRRAETKNALGKVSSVRDAKGKTISFSFDSDGNLRFNAAANEVCAAVDRNDILEITYDRRGRKQSSADPDMGTWVYQYNGFGDLVIQGDGKWRPSTMKYDTLGRMVQRDDDSGTTRWIFDAAPHGIGKLAAMVSPSDSRLAGTCQTEFAPAPAAGEKHAGRSFHYNSYGDLEEVTDCVDGSTFLTSYGYDEFGRADHVRYPEARGKRFGIRYQYTTSGYLHHVTDESGKVMWVAKAMNAANQVTDEVLGNGVETESARNDATGWLLARTITAPNGMALVEGSRYAFDVMGNLRARQRIGSSGALVASETFEYDVIDRLLKAEVNVPTQGYAPETYSYDDLGNLDTKAGKAYKYGTGCTAGNRAAGPHALCQIDDGPTYNYDRNGNLVSVGDRTVEWNASNMARRLASGTGSETKTADFIYGADGQRVVQATGVGAGPLGSTSNSTLSRTVYVGLGATGKSVYERTTRGTTVEHSYFVYAAMAHGGSAFAIHVESVDASSSSTPRNEYHHFDHLGSVTAVSDDRGHVISSVSSGQSGSIVGYDPWGAIRSPDGHTATLVTYASPAGNRGFTDHEAIPSLGLVNMNGRVYDPVIGRFLSPDPNVAIASDLQSYNRYSYVENNPLRYTDPTGFYVRTLTGAQRFWRDYGSLVQMAEIAGSIVACYYGGPAGCYGASLLNSAINTTAAIQTGTPVFNAIYQGAVGFSIGVVAGAVGGTVAKAVEGAGGAVLGGAAAGAMMGVYSTVAAGGDLGENVLKGAAMGALAAGMAVAFRSANNVSRASAQQGGGAADGPKVRTSPLADENNDTAHLLSRQIDTSKLPWYARALVWATDASHSGWVIEGEGGSYLVEGGCPTCTPQGQGGQLQGSVTRFETVDEAYSAFATDNGTRSNVSVYDHGAFSISASDYKGIVDRFNAMGTTYNYASTNSNYFANWFGTQAGIGISINPTGSWYMPGPWLYQWNYANEAAGR